MNVVFPTQIGSFICMELYKRHLLSVDSGKPCAKVQPEFLIGGGGAIEGGQIRYPARDVKCQAETAKTAKSPTQKLGHQALRSHRPEQCSGRLPLTTSFTKHWWPRWDLRFLDHKMIGSQTRRKSHPQMWTRHLQPPGLQSSQIFTHLHMFPDDHKQATFPKISELAKYAEIKTSF